MEQVIEELQKIRRFQGHPGRFWPTFLELATRMARARSGILLEKGKELSAWKSLNVWPPQESRTSLSQPLLTVIEQVAATAAASESAWDCKRTNGNVGTDTVVLGIRLEGDEKDPVKVMVFLLDAMYAGDVEQTAKNLQLMADTPLIYEQGRRNEEAMKNAQYFSEALDLMVLLNAETRYMAAAMSFVNEIASRYHCQRTSIGWLDQGYVRMQAISHMERFEKKMDIVQSLEVAMEEAFDQDEEILWPPPAENTAVIRDHEAFASEEGTKFMLSLPIRLDNVTIGVLSCERTDSPFSEGEVRGLRIVCDQVARRLSDLKEHDRWFGARLASSARKAASRLIGIEHTAVKVAGILVSAVLVFLLFGSMSYRVEAPFILKSDDVRYLPTPFDGFIDEVHVKVGEEVAEGDLLLTLDSGDLLLEESAAIANQIRYSREAEKARAENALAEMKIALALADQAKARLDLVRYRLGRTDVRAPFDGVVVEGDLEELLGVPVTKGDVLLKISRLEKMYVELEVSERDIHELSTDASGEMAFISQPGIKFPFSVERIDPVAVTKEDEGNVFLVRGSFTGNRADWWRPGMSGVVKVSAGKRNVLWILTHRTMDYLRIRLWW